jgi:hypothetical protein
LVQQVRCTFSGWREARPAGVPPAVGLTGAGPEAQPHTSLVGHGHTFWQCDLRNRKKATNCFTNRHKCRAVQHTQRAQCPSYRRPARPIGPNNALQHATATGNNRRVCPGSRAPSTRGSASDPLPLMGVQRAAVRGPRAVSCCFTSAICFSCEATKARAFGRSVEPIPWSEVKRKRFSPVGSRSVGLAAGLSSPLLCAPAWRRAHLLGCSTSPRLAACPPAACCSARQRPV